MWVELQVAVLVIKQDAPILNPIESLRNLSKKNAIEIPYLNKTFYVN